MLDEIVETKQANSNDQVNLRLVTRRTTTVGDDSLNE